MNTETMLVSVVSKSNLKYFILNIVIGISYYLTAKFGQSLSGSTDQITLIWPPAGIALASILLWGYRLIPAVFLGAFFSRFVPGEFPFTTTAIAIGNTLAATSGVYLLRRFRFKTSLDSAKNAFLFIFLGSLIPPAMSATLGTLSLIQGNLISWSGFNSVWITWWLGDLMGILLFTPLMLAWLGGELISSRRQILESVFISLFITLASLLIFFPRAQSITSYPLEYLIFPVLIWGSFRFGQRGTTLSTVMVTSIALWATITWHGPFNLSLALQSNLIALQFFVIVLSSTAILLSSVIEEKIAAMRERDYSDKKFRALIEHSSDVFTLIDQNATIFYTSPSLSRVLGYTPQDFANTNIFRYIYPEDRDRLMQLFREILLTPQKTITAEYRSLTKDGGWKWMEGTGTNLLADPAVQGVAISYRDIDERKKLDVVKTEFVTLAAHQLRTPLTTMKWYTEALRGMVEAKSKVSEYVDAIYLSIMKMADLASLMLDVSRIELGTFVEKIEPVDIRTVIEAVVGDFSIESSDKHLHLVTTYRREIPPFEANPKVLRVVLQNLVGNAVHYTPDHGSVTVTVDIQPKQLTVEVQDTGIGIPETAQKKIFTKLFRAENSKKVSPDGTGLGLYLTKALVDKEKGKIWFSSVEGHGTTFYVNLPIKLLKRRPHANK